MLFYTPSKTGPRQGISLTLYGIAKLLQSMPQRNLEKQRYSFTFRPLYPSILLDEEAGWVPKSV